MLQYVNGTKEFKLRLQVHEELKVFLFADASFAVHADGKSHSGIVTTLGEGAVDAESTISRSWSRHPLQRASL